MATSKYMYFGTQERMAWVKCPAIDANISKAGWSTSSLFLNGGASVRRSASAHKEYSLSWGLASAADIAAVRDYCDGLYGQDLLYFLDPFAMSYNVLPQFWATPRLGADDAPVFDGIDTRPTLVDTTANTYGYPTKSAVYTFNTESQFARLFIPVPLGYALYFGAHGSSSGSAAVTVSDMVDVATTVVRVNQITNPAFTTNLTGWVSGGVASALSRQTSGGYISPAYGRSTAGTASSPLSVNANTFPVTAGEQFAFSAWVKGTAGRSVALRTAWVGAAATTGSTTTLTTSWQLITYTGTVPVGATAVRPDVWMASTGVVVGTVLDADAVLYERGTNVVGSYFDGDSETTSVGAVRTTQMWQGSPNDSPSQQTAVTAPGTAVTLMDNGALQTNTIVSGVAGVYISFWGSGTLTLSGMVAQVLPVGSPAPTGNFRSGQGHSGCRMATWPTVNGYSAPDALNLQSMSLSLTETGAWE